MLTPSRPPLLPVAAMAAAALLVTPLRVAALPLVSEGRTSARIWLASDAPPEVREAAAELARVLLAMTGAELPVTPLASAAELPADVPGVVLGSLAEQRGLTFPRRSPAGDGYRLLVRPPHLLIGGENGAGVYTGVCRFLETLGCGWYVPGPVGEVIPSLTTVIIPDDLDQLGLSDSINRRFWYGGKNRNGAATEAWLRRHNGGNPETGSWSHAYAHLLPAEAKKAHPEYGSLNRGQRTFKQLCTTHPEVIRLGAETLQANMAKSPAQRVFPAGPNDGGNLCECPTCATLDTPGYVEPSSGRPACSDRIFAFAGALAQRTAATFPDRDLGILVYSEYSRLPKKLDRVHANVFPMIAPIRRCRLHGPGHPDCEMAQLLQTEIAGWAARSPKLGFYVYNYNLADTLVPFTKRDYFRRLAASFRAAQVQQTAWICETIDSWAMHAPSLYLSARLTWSTATDFDTEFARFCTGFYGAAAAPMTRYWSRIDDAYSAAPTHTGSSYGLHKIWTPALLAACRADVDEAARLAATPREQEAVAMAEAGLRCAESFRRIWDAIATADFATAAREQAELGRHVAAMAQHTEPSWAHERYAFTQYFRRFLGLTIDGGAKQLADGGRIVHRFPDTWRFATDPQATGRDQGWHLPTHDAGAWRELGTMSTSWADEGLPFYQGDAWYRTTFTLPGDLPAADLRLWFGGFDYNVDVYLNGQPLGEKFGFAKPAEFAGLAPHLRPEAENTLIVRVSAGDLAELGTGGLMMPVLLYLATQPAAPAAPAAPDQPAYEM